MWKYLFVFVGLVGAALLVSGGVQAWFTYNQARNDAEALQQKDAQLAADQINTFLHDALHEVDSIVADEAAANVVFTSDQWTAEFVRAMRSDRTLIELSYADPSGQELADQLLFSPGPLSDRSTDPLFRAAETGRAVWGPVGGFRGQHTAALARRLEAPDGGVVTATLGLVFMTSAINAIDPPSGGDVYVVDGEGVVIGQTNEPAREGAPAYSRLSQVKTALASTGTGPSASVVATDFDGNDVLTTFLPVDGPRLIVFVEQPTSEAFRSLYSSLWRSAGILAGGLLVATAASYFFARRMVKPVRALRAGAARISGGDFDQVITVRTGDELEALGQEFNSMAGRLKESYATLELRVEERTRELTEALAQQTAMSEVLSIIASSPANLQPVLDAIVERAASLCRSRDVHIVRSHPDGYAVVIAYFGPSTYRLPQRVIVEQSDANVGSYVINHGVPNRWTGRDELRRRFPVTADLYDRPGAPPIHAGVGHPALH